MQSTAESVMTLYQWNILILPNKEEIFVGLRQRPETLPPFKPPEDEDEILPFTLRNSSAIKSFDEARGIGYTASGRRYVVLGKPSDPSGLIRLSVSQMLQQDQFQWKYEFLD